VAAPLIKFDKTKDIPRQVIRGLQMIREGKRVLTDARAALIQTRDGDGADAAHYARTVTECGYEAGDYASAAAAAKKSFEEVDSLWAKLDKPAGQGDETGAAIAQCPAIHGV
jgi:hypothetical protein